MLSSLLLITDSIGTLLDARVSEIDTDFTFQYSRLLLFQMTVIDRYMRPDNQHSSLTQDTLRQVTGRAHQVSDTGIEGNLEVKDSKWSLFKKLEGESSYLTAAMAEFREQGQIEVEGNDFD